jgi:hypothetical protein
MSEGLEAAPNAEVGGEKGIGVAERAHGDVGRRPRADPRQCEQRSLGGGALDVVAAAVEGHLAASQRPGEPEHRAPSRHRHGERAGI